MCGSTSANYPISDLIRNLNIAYNNVSRLIWTSAGGWQYDDSNNTASPFIRTTLSHGVQEYALASTIQRVEEVVVKDKSGTWLKLKSFDIHNTDQAPLTYLSASGLPLYYDLFGNSILLYPKPSSAYVTMSSGMGVYVSRNVTEFPVTATTTVPGFAIPFHRILSYSAALDFLTDNNQRQLIDNMKSRLEQGLINFYAKRGGEQTTGIKPRSRKVWQQYI